MAGVAKLGRFARRLGGLGSEVVIEDAPHPGHVQLAETIHLRLPLDGNALRPDGLDQVRVAFLDDQAARNALRELRDPVHWQRIGKSQLEHAGFRRGFAHMHERYPRSDDAK